MLPYDRVIQRVIPHIEHHQNRYARGLAERVRDGTRWLDVGSGARVHGGWIGVASADLAARSVGIVGCDVVVEHLRANAEIRYAVGAEAGHLPFADESFDLVTANMVLEHLEQPHEVFAEIARVLKPGGYFVFVTPNRGNPIVAIAWLVMSRGARRTLAKHVEQRDAEHIFPTYYRANTVADLRRLIADLPLRDRLVERFNSYPFIRRPWPLTAIESLWIRLIQRKYLRGLCSNLYGEFQRV